MSKLVKFNAADFGHNIELIRFAYRELPIGLQRRQLKSAMKKAVVPYLPDFRREAPVGKTGRLRKSPITTTSLDSVSGRFSARVGYGRSRGKLGHHAILVHDGTKERKTAAGHNRGKVTGSKFAEPIAARIRSQGAVNFETILFASLEAGVRQLQRYISARVKSRAKRGKY